MKNIYPRCLYFKSEKLGLLIVYFKIFYERTVATGTVFSRDMQILLQLALIGKPI